MSTASRESSGFGKQKSGLPARRMATLLTNYTDDVKEGIAAFHAKRKPKFRGA
jgi:1,4-dihydroxy-2-naphthoyl-CoA synthase